MRGLVNHLRYVCLLQQGARPRDEWAFAPEEVARLQAQANQLSDAQVVRGPGPAGRRPGADPPRRRRPAPAAGAGGRPPEPPRPGRERAGAGRPRGGPGGRPPRRPAPRRRRAAAPAPAPGPTRGRSRSLRRPTSRTRRRPPPRRPRPRSPSRRRRRPPTAPAPADLEHFARLWSQILDVLEREAPPTRGFLDGSRPTRGGRAYARGHGHQRDAGEHAGEPATTGSACAPP